MYEMAMKSEFNKLVSTTALEECEGFISLALMFSKMSTRIE